MEMPKLTEHHRKLERLVGNWVGEEKIHPSPWDPKGGTAKSYWSTRLDLDGFYLLTDYRQERDGKVVFRGHGVYGYEPQKGKYTEYWFDTMTTGAVEAVYGNWDGDRLVFERKGPEGTSRDVYITRKDGGFDFRIETSSDGREWKPFIEGKYNRAR